MMISAPRRRGGVDDVDLPEQGFAKPSKRRGRGGGAAALWHRGGAARVEMEVAAALRGEGCG